MNLQAELDRAFAVAAAVSGDAITWQRGGSSLGITAILGSGNELEAAPLGATVWAIVRLVDFASLNPPRPIEGDAAIVSGNQYSVYRVDAFPDNTAKAWLKRR